MTALLLLAAILGPCADESRAIRHDADACYRAQAHERARCFDRARRAWLRWAAHCYVPGTEPGTRAVRL